MLNVLFPLYWCSCIFILDEERPVALGQCSNVSQEVSRGPDSLYIQGVRCPPGVYVGTHAHTHTPFSVLWRSDADLHLNLSLFCSGDYVNALAHYEKGMTRNNKVSTLPVLQPFPLILVKQLLWCWFFVEVFFLLYLSCNPNSYFGLVAVLLNKYTIDCHMWSANFQEKQLLVLYVIKNK